MPAHVGNASLEPGLFRVAERIRVARLHAPHLVNNGRNGGTVVFAPTVNFHFGFPKCHEQTSFAASLDLTAGKPTRIAAKVIAR